MYDGSAATRKAGRQSSSQQATSRVGEWAVSSRAVMSRKPRTALIGRPSGDVMDVGTPKKARKYRDAASSSIVVTLADGSRPATAGGDRRRS